MRTILPIFVLALCATVPADGQAIRFDSQSTTTSAQCVSGKQCPLLVLPGTQVNFCQGTPSTLSACLGSPATTYRDASAGIACATTSQLTPAAGGACLSTADAQGGYGAWLLPGSYGYYLRVPATAGGGTYGPYPFSIHGDSGGYTLDSLYTTLAQACTAAGTGTLGITRAWNATPSQTLGCSLWFLGDGKIQTATGATVIFGGNGFVCPSTQRCLDSTTNSGSAFRWTKLPPAVYPDWWGAKPDGTNSSSSCNAAVAAATASGKGGLVAWNAGDYTLGSTCTIDSANGLEFNGNGGLTRILWSGNNSTPVIRLSSSFHVKIHGLTAYFTASNPALSFVNIQTVSGQPASSSNVIRNLFIDTDHAVGTLIDVFTVNGAANYNANNDFMQFRDIIAFGYTHAAAVIQGSNSTSHQFFDCRFGENLGVSGLEKYGVYLTTADGMGGGAGATMQWRGGFMGVTVADFYSDAGEVYPNLVDGLNSESDGRLLQVVGAGQGTWVVENTRYVQYIAGPTDIVNFHGGNLVLRNDLLGNISGSTQNLTIIYNSVKNANAIDGLTVDNVKVNTSNQTLTSLFNPVGIGSGGSDINVGTWLTVVGVFKWQDPVDPTIGGEYARDYPAQPFVFTRFTNNATTTQNIGTLTGWIVENSGSGVHLKNILGGYTNMKLTVQGGAFDNGTIIDKTGNIYFTKSATITVVPTRTYEFVCTQGDGTTSFWSLYENP